MIRRKKGERRQAFLLRAHYLEGRRIFGKRWDETNTGWVMWWKTTGGCNA